MAIKKMNKYESLFRWTADKLKIQEKFKKNNQANWKVPRGAVYGCYLGENVGFEKGTLESRPVLVVSIDEINKSSGNVVVIPLSKNIKYKKDKNGNFTKQLKYSWHYVVKRSQRNKLKYNSAVQCEDIRVVSKSRLGNFIGFIDRADMKEVSKRIKKALQV